jgi:hypothetical protein
LRIEQVFKSQKFRRFERISLLLLLLLLLLLMIFDILQLEITSFDWWCSGSKILLV